MLGEAQRAENESLLRRTEKALSLAIRPLHSDMEFDCSFSQIEAVGKFVVK